MADALRFSIDHALRDRGGMSEVRRRSGGHPTHFGIRVSFELAESRGHYAFTVGARPRSGFEIQREECHVADRSGDGAQFYELERGHVLRSTLSPPPAAAVDRLYLVAVSGSSAFRPVYDALSRAGFYNLNPAAIRDLQPPDPGDLLKRDGSNAAGVLSNLAMRSLRFKARIEEYLGEVVPGLTAVARRPIAARVVPARALDALRPIRVRRQRFLKEGELERDVELAARRAGAGGGVLILIDAEGDCPGELAPEILRRARATRSDRAIRAVLAKMEYEAWFLAAIESLAGKRGISESVGPQPAPESIRGAKERLSRLMPDQPYSEMLDQPALTAIFDLDAARAAPSFDKLWRDVSSLLTSAGA